MGDTLRDLTGLKFGKWTVLKRAENRKRAIMWECACECGAIMIVHGTSLKSGTSVGCINCRVMPPRSHGLTHHPLYQTWQRMKGCTSNPTHQDYRYYGGRGISLCDEWEIDFTKFYEWAIGNGWEKGLTIERKNYDGDYCPENCTWVTIQAQQLNKRSNRRLTFNGETHSVTEWGRLVGIRPQVIFSRINTYGWSIERALTEPVRRW